MQEFLEMPALNEPLENAVINHTDVTLENVAFSYTGDKKDEVLHGINLTLKEGGFTAFVGPSGGEKQRIAIARMMLKNAPIVILDEATAFTDLENEHLIQSAISELTKGKTIITIAHRLATVKNADQILVVSNGEIAESGTHAELLEKEGIYKRFTEIREKAEGWRIEA